ncbi:MAG: hypothetical protein V4631_01675 [Pseudomonadota bacterium]
MKRPKILRSSSSQRRAVLIDELPVQRSQRDGWNEFFALIHEFQLTTEIERNQPDWPPGEEGKWQDKFK